MMHNRYIVRITSSEMTDDDSISHAQDAYTRRLKYDREKRHEKYLKDRDAGKTGYKGIQARTSNPYGNYASLYYNPEKAAAYYRAHAKKKTSGSATQAKQQSRVAAPVMQQTSGGSGGGGSGGSGGGGSGGSGGGGGGNADDLQKKLQKLREDSQFETAAQRKATKMKIEQLRDALKKALEGKAKERKEAVEKGKKEREKLSEKAKADIEKERKKRQAGIVADFDRLREEKENTVEPFRTENAKLRGQLESMSKTANPQLRARLQKQLARNNEKINDANAKYTDSLSESKTKHSVDMRNNITDIRNDLKNARTASSNTQKETLNKIRNDIKKLREDNKAEVTAAREALNKWISEEKKRVGKETARLRGVEYEDPDAKAAEYEARVEKRAKEILGQASSTPLSKTKSSKKTKQSKK